MQGIAGLVDVHGTEREAGIEQREAQRIAELGAGDPGSRRGEGLVDLAETDLLDVQPDVDGIAVLRRAAE